MDELKIFYFHANALGTLGGFLDLLLALLDASNNFEHLADATMKKTLEKRERNKVADQKTSAMAKNLMKKSDARELCPAIVRQSLLSGDLRKLIHSSHGVADVYNSFAENIRALANDVDHESLDVVGKLTDAQADLVKSLVQFSAALSGVKGPSKRFLKVSTALTAYDNAIHHAITSLKAETKSSRNAERKCNVSNEPSDEFKWDNYLTY